MRFREFAPPRRNRNQQVDEILPALAAGAARVLGGAALGLGGAALRSLGSAASDIIDQDDTDNQDEKVDEVLPALAAGAARVGGAALRGASSLAGAAVKGVGNLAAQGSKAIGQAAGSAATNIAKSAGQTATKALFTPQGLQRQMGAQPGKASSAQQGTVPPVQIKPGVKILHPGLGQTKIKSIQGKDAVLDTQKALGQDIRVDQNELLAVLGQGQPVQK